MPLGTYAILPGIWLMIEAGKRKIDPSYISEFEPYFNVLPTNMEDYPILYNEEDMALLKGTDAQTIVTGLRILQDRQFEYMCEQVEEMKAFTIEDFRKYLTIANSR